MSALGLTELELIMVIIHIIVVIALVVVTLARNNRIDK